MDEKEVINGYAVDSSIWVGTQRICFGIAEDRKEEYPYMVCVFESEGYVFPMCDKMACYDVFTEGLNAYSKKISECAKALDERRAALEVDDPTCLKADAVEPAPWDVCIRNKVVALDEHTMNHGFRDIAHQLFYVYSGFGVEAKSRGRACYGFNLYTGEKCRIERPDVMGIVPEDRLPDFAKKNLVAAKEKAHKERDKDAR